MLADIVRYNMYGIGLDFILGMMFGVEILDKETCEDCQVVFGIIFAFGPLRICFTREPT